MVPRSDRETRYSATVEQMFRFCAGRFGLQFVEAVLNTEVGSPRLAEFVVTVKNGEHEARRQLVANLHDLALVYFSGRIISATRSRSEEHTSELQSLMRNSSAVFCLKKTKIPYS